MTVYVLVASVKFLHERNQMRTPQNGLKNIFSGRSFARNLAHDHCNADPELESQNL